MCGIIGIIGKGAVTPLLVDALRRLEYRGYDSAGVATLIGGKIERRRAEGKLDNLVQRPAEHPVEGRIGIGHTRWATHGVPNETNAHPVATDRVAVVHNGIIENFQELRRELSDLGFSFQTQTDTEAVAIMVTRYLGEGATPQRAVAKTLRRLEGAFPLAIGFGEGEMYIGSDALALAPLTRRICYLEEGDWAVLSAQGATLYDAEDRKIERAIRETALSGALIGKGNHRHFMQKEIFEQPAVIGDTLHALFNPTTRSVNLGALPFDLAALSKVTIIACGTSFHAAMVAKYWLERIARVPVEIDIASEFRYRAPDMPAGGLALFISQSGETADTLAALRYARGQKQHIAVVVNQPESTMAREADVVLPTRAGPEIGVAATKAFTTQLVVLACFAIAIARARGSIDRAREAALSSALTEVPSRASEVLNNDEKIREIAAAMLEARDVLYLGRGTSYPLALEGALKLKEISYIHAEGYAAGEMKHGPIALIDDNMPVVVIAPYDRVFEKTVSNMQEVAARGGGIILMTDAKGAAEATIESLVTIVLPDMAATFTPMVYAVPVQLLAYHTAVIMGTDVDQPRNLAKSVTVE